MDAAKATPERSAELAALRRRAYGPDADIQRDPDALARLRELEGVSRPAAEPPAAVDAPEQPDPEAATGPAAPASDAPAAAASVIDTPPSDAPQRRWRTRILVAVAVAALLVGGVGGGIIGAALATSPASAADATLRIEPSNGAERGPGWERMLSSWGLDPTSTVPYESYRGLEIWTGASDAGDACLIVAGDGMLLAASCAAGDLDPTLDYRINPGSRYALDEHLPDGTLIRFVARESVVDVWLRTPAGWEPDDAQSIESSVSDSAPSAA